MLAQRQSPSRNLANPQHFREEVEPEARTELMHASSPMPLLAIMTLQSAHCVR